MKGKAMPVSKNPSVPDPSVPLIKFAWEWMEWIEYPCPVPSIPCVPGMLGTIGNDWEWMAIRGSAQIW